MVIDIHNLPKIIQEDKENLNISKSIKEIGLITKNLPNWFSQPSHC